jgi:hypothetical protein
MGLFFMFRNYMLELELELELELKSLRHKITMNSKYDSI